MSNVLRGSSQKTLLNVFHEVRTHDAFKLGPQPWYLSGQSQDAITPATAAEEILGVPSAIQFDGFMNTLFQKVWSKDSLSTASAVRGIIVLSASRCEERCGFWPQGLGSFADVAVLLEQYVSEREAFRKHVVSLKESGEEPTRKRPRFGSRGDTVSCSFTFGAGLTAVVDSWCFVDSLVSLTEPISWKGLHDMFKQYECKYSSSAFVTSHILENLVLLSHIKNRVRIVPEPSDKFYLVGLGPNAADFQASYLSGPDTGSVEDLGRKIMEKSVTARVPLPVASLVYSSPHAGITMTNVQDTICMIKKNHDYFSFGHIAAKNLYVPNSRYAENSGSGGSSEIGERSGDV